MLQQKYSIILPVRNGGEYVKECVHSILSQTLQDFNLIVLDNYSTDGTKEWIASLRNEKIKIIPSERSLSIEENWGRIKDIGKNEFITLIGHDDILAPNYLKVIDDVILQYPDASLYQTHFTYIDSRGNVLRECKPMPLTETAPEFLKSCLTNAFDVMGTGFMMRSKDYDALGGMPAYPNLIFADLELWFRLTRISYKVTAAETCFSFRIHQSTTSTTSDEKLQAAFDQVIIFLETLKKEGGEQAKLINENGITFIHHYCKYLSHRLLRTPQHLRKGVAVAAVIKKWKGYADQLIPGNKYDPMNDPKVRIAKYIDSNIISRKLFLLFKKVYSKPVYS
jgi:glycosyltransferase involved in cell wall biosynthesis